MFKYSIDDDPGVITLYKRYLEKQGYIVTRLSVDADGQLDPEALKQAIGPQTALISIMAANNETVVVLPVKELAEIATSFKRRLAKEDVVAVEPSDVA